ncbi:hypothetical protein GJ496_002928 [Pomphorhynchus laevis]|nr:hypothetical protein GJ496_002928 [Pomphorhynchus laevis]
MQGKHMIETNNRATVDAAEESASSNLSRKSATTGNHHHHSGNHTSGIFSKRLALPTTDNLRLMKEAVVALWKHSYSWPFHKPVDARVLKIPDYYRIIVEPMDLGTVKQRLNGNAYLSANECFSDLCLMLMNCYVYNKPSEDVVLMGQSIEKVLFSHVCKLPYDEEQLEPVIVNKCAGTIKSSRLLNRRLLKTEDSTVSDDITKFIKQEPRVPLVDGPSTRKQSRTQRLSSSGGSCNMVSTSKKPENKVATSVSRKHVTNSQSTIDSKHSIEKDNNSVSSGLNIHKSEPLKRKKAPKRDAPNSVDPECAFYTNHFECQLKDNQQFAR